MKGSILPKLTGEFSLGYRTLSYSTVTEDINALGFSSNLTWSHTPKLRTTFNLSKDFDAAGSGSTYEFTRLNLVTMFSINNEFKFSLNLGRTQKDFRSNPLIYGGNNDREEQIRSCSARLHYIPSQNYSIIAGYRIVRSEGDLIDDYDLNEFSVIAKLKY